MRPAYLTIALVLAGCECGSPAGASPVVRIVTPVDGAQLAGQGPHSLVGEVSDADETLSAANITWRSDRDGLLAQGASALALLSAGQHRLVLEAFDAQGHSGSAQVTVFVTGTTSTDGGTPRDGGTPGDAGVLPDGGRVDLPPVVTITAPMNNAAFDQGQAIVLTGTAVDPEDGALTGASLVWTSDLAGTVGSGTSVTFNNAALGAHRIVFTATDSGGNSVLASISVTVVRPGTNRAPVVTLSSPTNGAVLTLGQMTSLVGSATDAEDGTLSGSALTWSSSTQGALGTGTSLQVALMRGVHVLTLTATDSMGASASASVTVSVNQPNNQAPVATITSPTAPPTLFQGASLTLSGTGVDPEDGVLSGTALTWSSSRDGTLGTGSPLVTTSLTIGTHTLTLVARDSVGNTGTATLQATVLPANQPPVVTIAMPSSGTSVTSGTSVSFTGSALDPEDGALAGAALRWSSSRDGSLGAGASLTLAGLSIGAHTITLTATDSGGRTASAAITLTVTMGMMNAPPIARLTGPSTGQATTALSFDGSTSTDSDGTLTNWRFDFGDGSAVQTGTMQQAVHTYAAAGSYTVTLTVTDNLGASATATLTVGISAFVRVPVVALSAVGDVGGACSLVTPGSRVFLAWTSATHPGVHFGEYVNGTLQAEVVDAMGFNTGGVVRQHVQLVLGASNQPHVVYVKDNQVWWATKSGGVWTRERVDSVSQPLATNFFSGNDDERSFPSLVLNGGGAPVVLYPSGQSNLSTNRLRPVLSTRSAANTWTQVVAMPSSFLTSQNQLPVGDLVLDGQGRFVFPLDGYDGFAFTQVLIGWSGTAGAFFQLPAGVGRSSLVRFNDRLYALGANGVWDVALNATFASSTSRRSLVEMFSTTQHAAAVDAAGLPRLVVNHGGELESVWSDAGGFWSRVDLGAADPGLIDASVDGADQTRACFVRASKLMLY
jgi:PKD repeat protein